MLLCDCCGLTFSSRSLLKWHKRKHESDGPFMCANCNQRFDKCHLLQSHLSENYKGNKEKIYSIPYISTEQQNEYICFVCDATFRFKCEIESHLMGHFREKIVGMNKIEVFHCNKNSKCLESKCTNMPSEQDLPASPSYCKQIDVVTTELSVPATIIVPRLVPLLPLLKDESLPKDAFKRIKPKPDPNTNPVKLVPLHALFAKPQCSGQKETKSVVKCCVGTNTDPITTRKRKSARMSNKCVVSNSQTTQTSTWNDKYQCKQATAMSIFDSQCLDVSLSSVDMHELQAMLDKPGDGSVAAAEEILQELVANNPADFRHDFN